MSAPEAVLVLTTVAEESDAKRLADLLVEEQLAACVNIVPGVLSVYRWETRVNRDDEFLLLIKTRRSRLEFLRERLLDVHPYDVPEFVVISIDGLSDAYGRWLANSTAVT